MNAQALLLALLLASPWSPDADARHRARRGPGGAAAEWVEAAALLLAPPSPESPACLRDARATPGAYGKALTVLWLLGADLAAWMQGYYCGYTPVNMAVDHFRRWLWRGSPW